MDDEKRDDIAARHAIRPAAMALAMPPLIAVGQLAIPVRPTY
ncbi:MAG: hypothetical protein ACRC6F_08265 [Aeromonas sp.]